MNLALFFLIFGFLTFSNKTKIVLSDNNDKKDFSDMNSAFIYIQNNNFTSLISIIFDAEYELYSFTNFQIEINQMMIIEF